MSAQPIHHEDSHDPQVILRDLPLRERPEFLRQYRAAAEAARDDVAQYQALQQMLHQWSLIVVAANQPGYYQAIDDAKADTGRTVSLGDAIAAERARRRS